VTGTVFTGHEPGSSAYRRLFAGLFCAGIATFAQLYAPQAVLPQIAADLRVPPATAALAVSAATLGLAAAVVPWSLVADRIGRVPAMAVGVIIATAFGVGAICTSDLALLLVLRLGEGIGLGAVPAVALVYLSEEVAGRHTAAAAGGYIAGTTVGGLSGRLIAGPVGEIGGWRIGIAATIVVCAIAAAAFLLLVPRARGFVPGRRRIDRGPGILARLAAPLRSARQRTLYLQGFLLMGAFVAVYNYLGFHLAAPPFLLPVWAVSLLFLAYPAGTVSSPWAGALASRHGRYRVLIGSVIVAAVGAGMLAVPATPVIVLGLVVFTAGFFGAHAVASGWTPVAAPEGSRAQASSLYYLGYYGGSSLFGWLLGYVFGGAGWGWFVTTIIALIAVAGVAAAVVLRER